MVYSGKFQDGVIVLDDSTGLKNGECVKVDPVPAGAETTSSGGATWAENFKEFIGAAKDLPVDMARNHDHCIHGTPKK